MTQPIIDVSQYPSLHSTSIQYQCLFNFCCLLSGQQPHPPEPDSSDERAAALEAELNTLRVVTRTCFAGCVKTLLQSRAVHCAALLALEECWRDHLGILRPLPGQEKKKQAKRRTPSSMDVCEDGKVTDR